MSLFKWDEKRFVDTSKKARSTKFRKSCVDKQKRQVPLLVRKGWKHDGLWWHSPYTGIRYHKTEALYVEELRLWASKSTSYLEDKDHSTWSMQREEEYRILTPEEFLAKISKKISK